MSSVHVNAEHLKEFLTLVGHIGTHKQSNRFQLKLFALLDFEPDEFSHDFYKKAMAYLTSAPEETPRAEFDFNKGDDLPDSMKEEHTQKIDAGPLEIWIDTKEGRFTTSVISKYMLDSGWDFIDHRNIKSPLQKPVKEVKELLQEQVVDGKLYADLTPPLRGLLELIVKAFLNWHEANKPQPKRFGEL